jgi:hypothetical protein
LDSFKSSEPVYIAAIIGVFGVICAALIGILPDIMDRLPKASETPGIYESTPTATSLIEPTWTSTPTALIVPTSTPSLTPIQPNSNGLPVGYTVYDNFSALNSLSELWRVDDSKKMCDLTEGGGSLSFDCSNKTKNDLNASLQPDKGFTSLSGAAAMVTVTESGGPLQLTTGWKCTTNSDERAFYLALDINQVTASEFYPQEGWREQALGQMSVTAGQPHLLQIEALNGSVTFLVDNQSIPLSTLPDFPTCLKMDNWGFTFFVWKDVNTLKGQIDVAGFKP